jgi:hypothetical protein
MGEEHREQVELIPNPGAGGDIAERVVGFELGGAGRFSLGGEGEGRRGKGSVERSSPRASPAVWGDLPAALAIALLA